MTESSYIDFVSAKIICLYVRLPIECMYKHIIFALGTDTTAWNSIVPLISRNSMSRMSSFYVRYSFQAAVYAIWREWNKLKHIVFAYLYSEEIHRQRGKDKVKLDENKKGKSMDGALQF